MDENERRRGRLGHAHNIYSRGQQEYSGSIDSLENKEDVGALPPRCYLEKLNDGILTFATSKSVDLTQCGLREAIIPLIMLCTDHSSE